MGLFKIIMIPVTVLVVCFVLLVLFLTATEYRPNSVERLELRGSSNSTVKIGEEINIVSWNVGYAGLGEGADFFMDGGKSVVSSTKEEVGENLKAIKQQTLLLNPDIILFQEVDRRSHRSYNIDEIKEIETALSGYTSADAINYSCLFVPYPIPPIMNVKTGLLSLSKFKVEDAKRLSLPSPFNWPVSLANLKRCLLVTRHNIENSDKELVVINLHLEAYDDGNGKLLQTKALKNIMQLEYEKGNYVVVAGDFNQSFSNTDIKKYDSGDTNIWQPGKIAVEEFTDFILKMDSSTPSCRSLDRPYNRNDPKFQFYVIDGAIVSKNVELISFNTIDLDFKNSDHNPVQFKIRLK